MSHIITYMPYKEICMANANYRNPSLFAVFGIGGFQFTWFPKIYQVSVFADTNSLLRHTSCKLIIVPICKFFPVPVPRYSRFSVFSAFFLFQLPANTEGFLYILEIYLKNFNFFTEEFKIE